MTTAGSGSVTTACGDASGTGDLDTTVTLNNGGAVTYTAAYSVAYGATGSLANTVSVAPPAGVTDPTSSNDSATDTDTVNLKADLAVTKTDGVTTVDAGGSGRSRPTPGCNRFTAKMPITIDTIDAPTNQPVNL